MGKNTFKSRIFKGLFGSYILIIVSLFIVYTAVLLFESSGINKERKEEYYNLKIEELSGTLDVQFIQADLIISNINSSQIISDYTINKKYGINNTNNSYDVISVLKSYTNSAENFNIYGTVLFVDGYDTAYTNLQTFQMNNAFNSDGNVNANGVATGTINNILGQNLRGSIFNKECVVYIGDFGNIACNGKICIIFDKDFIENTVKEILADETGVRLRLGQQDIYSNGELSDSHKTYEKHSTINEKLTYYFDVDNSNMAMKINVYLLGAICTAAFVSVAFIAVALVVSNRFYRPVGNIEQIIVNNDDGVIGHGSGRGNGRNSEFDDIINGIQSLIGERNGYREKMVSIRPYAQQGVLHGIISGNITPDNLDFNFEKEYMVLQKPFFILGIVNVAYTGKAMCDMKICQSIKHSIVDICNKVSTEETTVVAYDKDELNTYIIINSNKDGFEDNGADSMFYSIFHKISDLDNPDYVLTIGVDMVREDIGEINQAVKNAEKTLGSMIIRGRGAVYFYEQEINEDKHRYYFPKDSLERVTKALNNGRLDDIRRFLDELLEVNTSKYDASADTIQLLIDEVHITTVKAIKSMPFFETMEFSIQKLDTVATLEEVLNYYFAIYETIYMKMTESAAIKKDIEELDKEILEYIDDNYTNPDMSLQLISEKYGVSNKYITNMCKKYLGKTYLNYLQDKRIDKAEAMIKEKKYTLEQIARECGYSSMLTFRRNFKNIKGVNPSEIQE